MSSMRVGVLSSVLLLLPSVYTASATEPDDLLTSTNQFSSIFSEMGWGFPYLSPKEDHDYCVAKYQWWTDFSTLPQAVSDAFTDSSATSDGIKVLPLKLVLDVESGGIAVKTDSGDTLLSVSKPSTYDAAAKYTALFNAWNPFFCVGYSDHCAEQLQPERLVLRVFLADINDWEDCAAMEMESQLTSSSQGMETSSEESEDFDIASASYQTNFCQGIPVTAISRVATNIRLNWTSITNDTYAVQYADNMEWFNTWHLVADNLTNLPSTAAWDDVGILSSNVTKRFYRVVRKDANYGLPCVTVLSPTNGATLSGTVGVGVYATDDSRISSITLVIDGNDFATVTDGPMSFPVPTALFSNGVHTIYARAADNVGLPGLGGDPDSDVVANIANSETVHVNFQNNIFLSTFELFESQLPIQASLVYSNASWSIQIEREDGTALKNFSGTTSNGTISVTWDGTDNSAVAVPAKTNYFVTVTATPLGQFAASSTTTDSVAKATYRETSASTGYILLARQKLKLCCLPPTRFLWEGVSAQKLVNIRTTIGVNDPDETDNINGVYLNNIYVMQADADWDNLLNELADPGPREITAFYYNGHSIGDKMGYHEFTPNKGLDYAEVALRLDNFYNYNPKKGVWVAKFGTPYKFVFLDGCLSGTGPWPRAFGILKNQMNYSVVGAKNRAFLGWGDLVESSLYSNAQDNFTQRFWQRWTEQPNRTLNEAILLALNQTPGVDGNKLLRFGYQDVTWGE
jgi:hypothetical protein